MKQILFLLCITCSPVVLSAQVWSQSFTAGTDDSNGKFLGGSEVLQLVNHKEMLFASVGYWQDGNNIWYGGSNINIGWGQINCLDNPSGAWKEDLFLGANYLRPEVLKQIIFTKDQMGNLLPTPDTVLIAAGFSPNFITSVVTVKSFVRNDITGSWGESQIVQGGFSAGEDYSVRDVQIYIDHLTGLENVFATVGPQGIYKGKYNPSIPGKIDWIATPEFGPISIRSLGITVANDTLYFSSGNKLFKRIDGEFPSYILVHDFSDLSSTINSAVGGIRGLTTIDNPSANNEALLLMWCPDSQSKGVIYRLEPDGAGGLNRIYEIKLSVLIESFLVGSSTKYVLGGYNEFYKYFDPISNETFHLVGFEATIIGGGHPTWNGFYKGALFARRDSNGQYSIEEINGTIGTNDEVLVANRCYVSSPFANENALYFGGFDPNGYISTNKAWVFKKDYVINSVDGFTEPKNNFILYPNPVSDHLFIETKNTNDQKFSIVNLLGETMLFGRLNGPIHVVDISSLTPNVYIFRIGNDSIKFIKS